ncbi:MAG TPA: pyrroline-5-carboxylate reductase [Spirochaetota bacterium]|nr:pyrroline-5-carboxylate reductase [Spirochaetota bacterium]HOR43542.1 pyrroline-5-carboxylate reductase [Spirochaetota bacterium]HPK55702.1 pyrroline-5-carboxylate reductase [Spirochaetota bacterium]
MDKKIAIVGLGNMGYAIAAGLAKNFHGEIIGFDNHPAAVENFKTISSTSCTITSASSEKEAAEKCGIIIYALKPDVILNILRETGDLLKNKLIISIAAGVTLDSITKALPDGTSAVRVMPNTPALISEGMSVLCKNAFVTEKQMSSAENIFKAVGKTLILPEKHIDAVTAISGCGPAYVFTFIQALSDAGVALGLARKDALLLACQTLKGASEMTMQSGEEPISLRNKVTSPGGSTIDAVHVLERAAFSGIVIDAAVKACDKSKKLGEK